MFVVPFPAINPVLIQVGPVAVKWYGLAYVAGLLFAWWYIVRLVKQKSLWLRPPHNGRAPATQRDVDDLVIWATAGVILGGRLGYVLFYGLVYQADYYLSAPWHVFAAWEGGMSFHGGLIGVVLTVVFFARRRKVDAIRLGDLAAVATPIGLFFGRLANFVNGELWGKVSAVPWAMVFPNPAAGPLPRHPSQLYEAGLEGLLLFMILNVAIFRFRTLDRPGLTSAIFLFGYGTFRMVGEIFRDSDQWVISPHSGFTMGMALSVPMWIAAALFLRFALLNARS